MHALIAYFSRSGENYVNGSIQNLEIGNTALAAKLLQELTGADLFQIESATAYSSHYSKCIDEAKADQRRNARPALKYCPENMAQYDTIYLGYPNYWGTMPMVVFTFLEQYDFSHKTIFFPDDLVDIADPFFTFFREILHPVADLCAASILYHSALFHLHAEFIQLFHHKKLTGSHLERH